MSFDRSHMTEEELLNTVAVVGEWVEPRDLTIDYFMRYIGVATERGYTRWATQTNKDATPIVSRIIFLRRQA